MEGSIDLGGNRRTQLRKERNRIPTIRENCTSCLFLLFTWEKPIIAVLFSKLAWANDRVNIGLRNMTARQCQCRSFLSIGTVKLFVRIYELSFCSDHLLNNPSLTISSPGAPEHATLSLHVVHTPLSVRLSRSLPHLVLSITHYLSSISTALQRLFQVIARKWSLHLWIGSSMESTEVSLSTARQRQHGQAWKSNLLSH